MEELNVLENELIRLQKICKNNNWQEVRNKDNYILSEIVYKWAKRYYYKIPNDKYNLYLDLQASRGLEDYENEGIENYINNRKKELSNNDFLNLKHNKGRHGEIQNILLNKNKIENLFEIGFRFPLLLKSYQDLNINVSGCDTVKSNVLLGKYLNFNVELLDFNNYNDINNIKLKEKTLIISYHCFEHLENPLNSLNTLYKIMPIDSYLHIEVPLEPIKYPNTRFAHLQTFYKDDLKNMLNEVGFNFLNSFYDNKNERHLVSK